MSWFTKQVTVLNRELDSLEMLVHQAGMKMGELQRMQVEAGENIQGADEALTKALEFISNAEVSLGIASSYISKYKQYYKSEEARKFWEGDGYEV